MDRPKAPPRPAEDAVAVLLGDPREPTEQIDMKRAQMFHAARSVRILSVVLAAVVGALLLSVPRVQAYPSLLEENFDLKQRLLGIERRMSEVDRMLMRLRLYDAQLRSLSEARGSNGPIPEEAWSNARLIDAYRTVEIPDDEALTAPAAASISPIVPQDLRPAESWALAVRSRVDHFLDVFTLGEPDINALVSDLEALRAVRLALPGRWPAQGHLTSGFGWRRDPVHGSTKFHAGLDIANRRGAPIHAAAAGTVIQSRSVSGYGRTIVIDHGFGITTRYAHCTTLRVKEGEHVEMGDFIATMGSTGRSTGPHLHFELRIDNNAVDPLKYLPR